MVTVPNITLFDVCLGMIYLIVIYFFAFRYSQKKTNPLYRYFLFGLTTKIFGALLFVVISIYYYNKGDTFLYFQIAQDLRSHLFLDSSNTLELLFTSYSDLGDMNYNPLEKYNYFYERETNWVFGRMVFFFCTISCGSYLVTSIVMTIASFLGLWVGYKTICELYQRASKIMLIPFFLIPTALIWSSGILKDTLVIGVIGMLLYAFSKVFIYKKRILWNMTIISGGVFMLLLLKPILVFTLIPCFIFWGLLCLTKPISSTALKLLMRFSAVLGIILLGYFLNNNFVDISSKYKYANLINTLEGFQNFHSLEFFTKGKNVYKLGDVDMTPMGLFKKIPEAINVTFFRPYLWEINNWAMLLGALESLMLLLIFICLIVTVKKNFYFILLKNSEVIFMMSFAFAYAFIVGITSYNFGALSRYKIPAIMFFIISLVVIYVESESSIKPNFITKLIPESWRIKKNH